MEKIHEIKADEKLNIAIVGGGLVSTLINCHESSKFLIFLLWKVTSELIKDYNNKKKLSHKVGSLAALHLGKRGHQVNLYEYREGD